MIDELFDVIEARKRARPDDSYTVKLLDAGAAHVARKVGEEALEVMVAAMNESDERLLEECADLIYHVLVLLSVKGLDPDQLFEVLNRRRSPGRV